MIKVDIKEKGNENGDWIKLIQDKINWGALVKAEISLLLSLEC